MKRLFHRRTNSSSSASSSTSASPGSNVLPARSNSALSPIDNAAAFPAASLRTSPTTPIIPRHRRSSPTKVQQQPVDSSQALNTDELRAATRAFLDAASASSPSPLLSASTRRQALQALHNVLTHSHTHQEVPASAEHTIAAMSARDRRSVVTICAQQTQKRLRASLEHCTISSAREATEASQRLSITQEDARECIQMLDILHKLLVNHAHAAVIASAHLPSTLVALLRAAAMDDAISTSATTASDASASALQELVTHTLAFLGAAISYDVVVQELVGAHLLHPLFFLSFQHAQQRQLAGLVILERLVHARSRDMWTQTLVPLVIEHKCLIGLSDIAADDVLVLAKIVTLVASMLTQAAECGSMVLHSQMRIAQLYARLFARIAKVFESSQVQRSLDVRPATGSSGAADERAVQCDQDAIALALSNLVMSGNTSTTTPSVDVAMQKCFALHSDDKSTQLSHAITRSAFNSDAFQLLVDVLAYLHEPTPVEKQSARSSATANVPGDVRTLLQHHREQLECKCIEQIGRIVCRNRYDYVFVLHSQVLANMILRLDEYPDVAKAMIGSVLSAVAIEASVVPYDELVTATHVLNKRSSGTSSVAVLLSCLVNMLRFHDAYVRILRNVGALDSLLTLFQSQTMLLLCGLDDATHLVAIAHPTSKLALGAIDDTTAECVVVNARSLHALLEAHCVAAPASSSRVSATMQQSNRGATSTRDIAAVLDVLTVFADCIAQQHSSTRNDDDGNDDDIYAQMLCSIETLECLCWLITQAKYQEAALALWRTFARIALTLTRFHSTCVLNTTNCILQSIRSAALTLSSPADAAASCAALTNRLCSPLDALTALVRPLRRASPHANALATTLEPRACEQVVSALIECDAVHSCLAVLSALAALDPSSRDVNALDVLRVTRSTMQLLHVLIVGNAAAGDAFARTAMFGLYGDLLYQLVQRWREPSAANLEASGSGLHDTNQHVFLLWTLHALLGVAVGDLELADAVESDPSVLCRANKASATSSSRVVVHAGAFGIALQLLSLWCNWLRQDELHIILAFCNDVANEPGNAQALASHRLVDIVLRSCGVAPHTAAAEDDDNRSTTLSAALLSTQNVFHRELMALLKTIAVAGMSYHELALWIQSILTLSSIHAPSRANAVDMNASIDARAASTHGNGLLTTTSLIPTALLALFVELASPTWTRHTSGVRFDASTDGFAYLQIPEVHARSLSTSVGTASSAATSSIPSFSSVLKIWPPADGYTFLLWFRIDALETKAEREQLYRTCFLARTCFLCNSALRDETVLKCSHRACRPCVDALLLCGGECVICNPPMFHLFRFRSGDTKSVSEAFLKGPRVCMRTSATRTAVHQFSHTPIEPNKWYHAAFVHARQRFQSSTVSFYLNGILQDTAKISYPSSITSGQPLSGLVGIPPQARRRSSAKWTVGPFYLLDEPVTAFGINTVFAAGPRYDGLFAGATGAGEIPVCVDHLRVQNLAFIDDYLRDPLRALIESVDAERVSKNSFIRGSLTLASAASAAAAAIVHEMKSDASVFARIPTVVPLVNVPIHSDHVLLAYTPRNAACDSSSIIPSSRFDGRPIAQLMGGTAVVAPVVITDVLFEVCGSGCQVAYVLLDHASTTTDVELSLRVLRSAMRGSAQNLDAMEREHGYGIVNYLLHKKAPLLSRNTLELLFQIVGIDTDQEDDDVDVDSDSDERRSRRGSQHSIGVAATRESSIRNLLALQYFVLDYSLWQKVDTSTQRFLFSSLYACLVTGDDALRDRNRAQLQSLSIVRQLLYVFLDPHVEPDLLRVIVDLILVCLTGARDANVESHFSDVAAFLASTLSPKFAQSSSYKDDGDDDEAPSSDARAIPSAFATTRAVETMSSPVEIAIATLCLSPRGGKRSMTQQFVGSRKSRANSRTSFARVKAPDDNDSDNDDDATHHTSSDAKRKEHQANVQDLLLDILLKAVQKHDLKENKDRDESDGSVVTSSDASAMTTAAPSTTVASSSSGAGASGLTAAASRVQLPSSQRVTGFRKVLSPRWVSCFLFPSATSRCCVQIAPTTVILALKLLGTLLSRPRYEALFKKEGYYRMLTHGLPCSASTARCSNCTRAHGMLSRQPPVRPPSPRRRAQLDARSPFPLKEMWYTLFCILLGTPVDGIPHRIEFEMFYLSKDFEVNVQSDRILNINIVSVIVGVVRRHYDDPVAVDALRRHAQVDSVASRTVRSTFAAPPSSAATPAPAHTDAIFHTQVLAFLHHVYTNMPSFHRVLAASGNDKFRSEFLEELGLLICAASRQRILEKYAPTEKHVHETLLRDKKALSAYDAALCTIVLAENAAANDPADFDPFVHATAAGALRLLIGVLFTFLLESPRGSDVIESFLDTALGVDLSPPLHDGLWLHFHTLVVRGLVAKIRDRFTDESVLVDHKLFAPNVRDFLKLAVQKMHTWQRAQHGDGCPPPFACCSKEHFAGGPAELLDLALFILAETSVGSVGGSVASSSSSNNGFSLFASTSASLGGILQEKLTKGKKRRQIRQLIGRLNLSKPAELESLLDALYTTLNAVVLHMLRGHRVDASDAELVAMLQHVHVHHDVVLGSRNNEDKSFFVCLCRYLLQLLTDASVDVQEAAVHVWIDLMHMQRAFMVDLLTIEIRRAGAPPYSVNLMKNGFDVLLECPSLDATATTNACNDDNSSSSDSTQTSSICAVRSPAFVKFTKWLELVGPPLKELEITLDRTYLKSVVEAKEAVRDAWIAHHKQLAATTSKHARRAALRLDWLAEMAKTQAYALVEVQQKEFRRHVKWRQDRIDGQKFIARQWQHVQLSFLVHFLGSGITAADASCAARSNPVLLHAITASNASRTEQTDTSCRAYTWRLDFTEGPFRMRKRFLRSLECCDVHADTAVRHRNAADLSMSSVDVPASELRLSRRSIKRIVLRRRRYSESDVAALALSFSAPPAWHRRTARDAAVQETFADVSHDLLDTHDRVRDDLPQGWWRRGSFGDANDETKTCDDASSVWSSYSVDRRRDSIASSSTSNAECDGDGRDDVERSRTFSASRAESSTALHEQQADDDDVIDEKLRPLLMPDDAITDIFDCLRIDGMDSCPGVFLLCHDHAYIVDNYQRFEPPRRSGLDSAATPHRSSQTRVVEISHGSTTRLERGLSLRHRERRAADSLQDWRDAAINSHTPSSANTSSMLLLSNTSFTHQCRFWSYDDIVELHKRRYQLRHVAIEIFAHDGRNYLITFESLQQRESVFYSLLNRCPNVRGAANGMDRSAVSGDLYSQLRKLLRNNMTERWISGEISNFEYLMHLNTLAGRSYNDLTQYPVFPWVLSDYRSDVLDLNDPSVFRDLTKPMGALNREDEFRARYDGLSENPDASDVLAAKPFHYGTHYSSAAIVLYYLMRVEPFTTHLVQLQGGKYDHADRLFSSVLGAWNSAAGIENAQNGTQDVKELIPEFFYLPAFLENRNRIDFGRDQNGTTVDGVQLPPWAHGSAREFVRVNREALESPFVSANLHHWIDLIFGVKQQGALAVDACNVFYHLTYEGAVDLETIADPAMKRAIVDQINEFGQTPSQLFKTPHPPKTRVNASSGSSMLSTASSSIASTGPHSFGPLSSDGRGPHTSDAGVLASSSSLPIGGGSNFAAASPLTSRNALTSSFIGVMESSELMNRMQTILLNTGLGSSMDDTTRIVDEAALLHQELKREVAMNPLVVSFRSHQHTTPSTPPVRLRQLSTGGVAANLQQIAIVTGSVAREEKVAAVGDKCLLIPPRNHEFLAWGFQDRSIKVLSSGSSELGNGSDSKVLASFEVAVEVNVACITSDGRTVVTVGMAAPVIRIWDFSVKKSSLTSSGASRRRAYTMSLPTVGQTTRSLTLLATLVTPAHHAMIAAVHACRAFSIAVSGCSGGVLVMWDLNRMRYMFTLPSFTSRNEASRTIPTSRIPPELSSISNISINEVSGDIVASCGARFGVYDVNGSLLVRLCYDSLQLDSVFPRTQITALALNRSQKSEWSKEKAVVTGHAGGVLCIWAYSQCGSGDDGNGSKDEWSIELKGRHTVSDGSKTGGGAITAVFLSVDERKLYTGTNDGLLSVWTAPKSTLGHAQSS